MSQLLDYCTVPVGDVNGDAVLRHRCLMCPLPPLHRRYYVSHVHHCLACPTYAYAMVLSES